MNDFKRKVLTEYFTKIRNDLETIKNHPKFRNHILFDNRLNALIQVWETAMNSELADNSQEERITREIVESSNEMYLIKHLLEAETQIVSMEYEKTLLHTAKTIDLYVELENGNRVFLDVKTIQPENIDAWDNYIRIKQHLHGNVYLEKDGFGGIFWHKKFTARSKMLEYTIELEEKVPRNEEQEGTFMIFCSDGLDWHLDELEDFADFYKYNQHRGDDFFRNIEQHHISEKEIELKRNISGFCYFEREKFDSSEMKFRFNVRGPQMFGSNN
jgi:hypothetical protein